MMFDKAAPQKQVADWEIAGANPVLLMMKKQQEMQKQSDPRIQAYLRALMG